MNNTRFDGINQLKQEVKHLLQVSKDLYNWNSDLPTLNTPWFRFRLFKLLKSTWNNTVVSRTNLKKKPLSCFKVFICKLSDVFLNHVMLYRQEKVVAWRKFLRTVDCFCVSAAQSMRARAGVKGKLVQCFHQIKLKSSAYKKISSLLGAYIVSERPGHGQLKKPLTYTSRLSKCKTRGYKNPALVRTSQTVTSVKLGSVFTTTQPTSPRLLNLRNSVWYTKSRYSRCRQICTNITLLGGLMSFATLSEGSRVYYKVLVPASNFSALLCTISYLVAALFAIYLFQAHKHTQ